ncbi:hypothetical protein ElyMa_003392300 [Elysia marginata]|uniref:Protein kinase domain-containing protein n=1 Tax=Elysia marginata TaxID=1093978 RepID=A0AAV4JL91_9GAST|nr:hypothetical protein ElyMa_003392300 [Elysia marginata]
MPWNPYCSRVKTSMAYLKLSTPEDPEALRRFFSQRLDRLRPDNFLNSHQRFSRVFHTMAEQVSKENQVIIHDLQESDFFDMYGLKKLKVLGKGMSGEVILASQRSNFELFAVKVFSLAPDVQEKRMNSFPSPPGTVCVGRCLYGLCCYRHAILLGKRSLRLVRTREGGPQYRKTLHNTSGAGRREFTHAQHRT